MTQNAESTAMGRTVRSAVNVRMVVNATGGMASAHVSVNGSVSPVKKESHPNSSQDVLRRPHSRVTLYSPVNSQDTPLPFFCTNKRAVSLPESRNGETMGDRGFSKARSTLVSWATEWEWITQ